MSAENHGADRDRTCDIVLAKHALSQLSYSPNCSYDFNFGAVLLIMGLERLELSTPALSEQCSNQLSYRPEESIKEHNKNRSLKT